MKIETFTIQVAASKLTSRYDIIHLLNGLTNTSGILAVEVDDEDDDCTTSHNKRMGRHPKAETVEKPRKRMGRPPKTVKPDRSVGVNANGEKCERRKLEDGTFVEMRK